MTAVSIVFRPELMDKVDVEQLIVRLESNRDSYAQEFTETYGQLIAADSRLKEAEQRLASTGAHIRDLPMWMPWRITRSLRTALRWLRTR